MSESASILFIHGSDSSSQTYKAQLLRRLFPGMLTPDFDGNLPQRMEKLEKILDPQTGWTLIGSSLGGLMASLYAIQHPRRVRKLVLLAPPLALLDYGEYPDAQISVPTIIIHGTLDEIVPLATTRPLAEKIFTNLRYIVAEDDHRLHKTAEELDWKKLLE